MPRQKTKRKASDAPKRRHQRIVRQSQPMTTKERKYDAKEQARLQMQEAIRSYYLAAAEYGCGAYDLGNEISDAVWEATDRCVKVVPEDV